MLGIRSGERRRKADSDGNRRLGLMGRLRGIRIDKRYKKKNKYGIIFLLIDGGTENGKEKKPSDRLLW